jgi:hypothetical protein
MKARRIASSILQASHVRHAKSTMFSADLNRSAAEALGDSNFRFA